MSDHRAGTGHCTGAKRHWGDQQRVRAGRGVVTNDGRALDTRLAAVVAGNRSCPDVDALANLGVTGIAEVMDLRFPPDS